MKRILAAFILSSLLLFSSCAEAALISEAVSEEIIYKTVDGIELGLEILSPTSNVKRSSPAVIVLHGGGWVSGSREDFTRDFEPLCDFLRDEGIAVISVSYRLAGASSSWRNCLDDCEDALSYIIENSKRLGIDPENIGMIGYSAGGQLALMAAIETREQVKYCVSMSGPTCFSTDPASIFYSDTLNYYIDLIFKESDYIEMYQASPIIRINRKCRTEFLLISGTDDIVVNPNHAERFMNEIETFGITAELLEIEGLTHSYTSLNDFEKLCAEIANKTADKLK